MNASIIPDGFEPFEYTSPFTEMLAPIYIRRVPPDTVILGLRLERRHCNNAGVVHGGVISTLADLALIRSVRPPDNSPPTWLTASLGLNFLGGAKEGEWLEFCSVRKKGGARMAFATCEIRTAERIVATANGAFFNFAPAGPKQ